MTSKDWPHFNQPNGWFLSPGDTVTTDGFRHNLTLYAKESRAYIKARDARLKTYNQDIPSEKGSSAQQTQIESPLAEKPSSPSRTTMKKRGKNKRIFRRRRPISAALRSRTVPFRMVLAVTTTAGLYTRLISMKAVAREYIKTFDEFRCTRMSVRFVPSALTTEGVYTTVLLDGSGFGSMTSNASTWFTRIGDMPGSVLRHCASGFMHRWRSTSPNSKNWIRLATEDFTVATVYIASSDPKTEVVGAIHITGSIRVRGEFYSAVGQLRRYASLQALDDLSIVDPSDDCNM